MQEGKQGLMIKLFLRRVGAATIPLGQDRHTAIASGVYTLGLLGILGPSRVSRCQVWGRVSKADPEPAFLGIRG